MWCECARVRSAERWRFMSDRAIAAEASWDPLGLAPMEPLLRVKARPASAV
jgi:hypothetical protein